MAEENQNVASQEPEATKQPLPKKRGKKGLVIGATLFVFLVGAFLGWWFLFYNKTESNATEKKKIDTENISLEPFVVNLADIDSARYVKVTIQLEVNKKEIEQVRKKTGHIRDTIIYVISNKTYDELLSNEGKTFLKDEIKTKLKRLFDKEDTIVNVLFLDFIMQ